MLTKARPLDPTASRASAVKRAAMRVGRWTYHRSFDLMQRAGVHVVPNHFYGPIPDTRQLGDELWERPSEAVGVDMLAHEQLALLDEISGFKSEYDRFPAHPTGATTDYYYVNGKFGAVDGGMLHGLLRHFKPARMLEVGSGFSTMLAAHAHRLNEVDTGVRTEYTVVDPYPHDTVASGLPGVDRLITTRVQDVPMDEFTRLGHGDVLFIDTSHVIRTGGDVQFEFLEVLPRLQKGVIVHVHDIYLPAEYPREWVLDGLTFWSEQYVLQAFLAFNTAFDVMLAGQYLHLYYPDRLKEAFGLYDGERWIGSFWFRRVA